MNKLSFKAYNYFLMGCVLTLFIAACKKADNFHQLQTILPQIDYSRPYSSSYVVGDTIVITGILKPKNNLQIDIGGVTAKITKTAEVPGPVYNLSGELKNTTEDQVSVLISPDMAGLARKVQITTGGHTIQGSQIDVYTVGGPGSFDGALKSVLITTDALQTNYKFFNAITGKGDTWFYAPATNDIRQITKTGALNIIYDLSSLNIVSFSTGAVDSVEQHLYFAGSDRSGFFLYNLNLSTRTLTVMNRSLGLRAPYEGPIQSAQMQIGSIYPDSKGNLYLGIGVGKGSGVNYVPDAIAHYDINSGNVHYVFKNLASNTYPGMPGAIIPSNAINLSISNEEGLLYLRYPSSVSSNIGIQLFDLTTAAKIGDVEPALGSSAASVYNLTSSFKNLKFDLRNSVDNSFGFLPMSNHRLQVLLFQNYQDYGSHGFPKWMVFDFAAQRTYQYETGTFIQNQYKFQTNDQLLNYDEDGNLYMTSNGQSSLIKTQSLN